MKKINRGKTEKPRDTSPCAKALQDFGLYSRTGCAGKDEKSCEQFTKDLNDALKNCGFPEPPISRR